MPNRVLQADILISEQVDSLSMGAELFYRRLLSVVDDYGRYDGRAIMLRSACYPLRVDTVSNADIEGWLAETVRAGLVIAYSIGAHRYLEMSEFRQRNRAKVSQYPAHDSHMAVICPPDDRHLSVMVPQDDGHLAVGIPSHAPPDVVCPPHDGACQSPDGVCPSHDGHMTARAYTPGGDEGGDEGVGVGGDDSPRRPSATDGDNVGERAPEPPAKPVKSLPEQWARDAADRLNAGLSSLNPNYVQPTAARKTLWATDIQRIHTVDGVVVAVIDRVLAWVLRDPFWQNNVQSGDALRRGWNKITAKMGAEAHGHRPDGNGNAGATGQGASGIRQREVDEQAERRRQQRAIVPAATTGAPSGNGSGPAPSPAGCARGGIQA